MHATRHTDRRTDRQTDIQAAELFETWDASAQLPEEMLSCIVQLPREDGTTRPIALLCSFHRLWGRWRHQ
eukprot:5667406-Prorocentrum_lima.AAC.1